MSTPNQPIWPSKNPGKNSGKKRTNNPPGIGKTPPPAPKPTTPIKPEP